ncbi:MAG: ATP-binding cassette domain-containing protein [Tissierellia bacterium]|nr:ATP-binding cassette domain-containing protein [Tissierellia bacterium]
MNRLTIGQLKGKYPFIVDYFEQNKLDTTGYEDRTFQEYIDDFNQEYLEDWAIDREKLVGDLWEYIEQMKQFLDLDDEGSVDSLTILPGYDKDGNAETFGGITIRTSEIISIVGPTGSGKSRLLADIEWTAQGDTPTGRKILINGEVPDSRWRFSSNNSLVAQLSQNMNFIMDLTVEEFLELHAKSRMVEDMESIIEKIIYAANRLAGEKFHLETPVTSLSGGQSRALMIADTAILSSSPIVLIDEIENAGIDRKKALEILVAEDKIVLMATHDPMLALMADKRIVIGNGGVVNIMETSEDEKDILLDLEKIDAIIQGLRDDLRSGNTLQFNDIGEVMGKCMMDAQEFLKAENW